VDERTRLAVRLRSLADSLAPYLVSEKGLLNEAADALDKRLCSKCHEWKAPDEFYGPNRNTCKACHPRRDRDQNTNYMREYRARKARKRR
jgi:hypothetical protein